MEQSRCDSTGDCIQIACGQDVYRCNEYLCIDGQCKLFGDEEPKPIDTTTTTTIPGTPVESDNNLLLVFGIVLCVAFIGGAIFLLFKFIIKKR